MPHLGTPEEPVMPHLAPRGYRARATCTVSLTEEPTLGGDYRAPPLWVCRAFPGPAGGGSSGYVGRAQRVAEGLKAVTRRPL